MGSGWPSPPYAERVSRDTFLAGVRRSLIHINDDPNLRRDVLELVCHTVPFDAFAGRRYCCWDPTSLCTGRRWTPSRKPRPLADRGESSPVPAAAYNVAAQLLASEARIDTTLRW